MLIGVCDLYLALFCIYVANGALQYMGTDVYSSPSGNLVLAKACFAPVFFGFLILIYVGKYFFKLSEFEIGRFVLSMSVITVSLFGTATSFGRAFLIWAGFINADDHPPWYIYAFFTTYKFIFEEIPAWMLTHMFGNPMDIAAIAHDRPWMGSILYLIAVLAYWALVVATKNINWYREVLKKYAVFSGRASRKEYWYFVLANVIITAVLKVIDDQVAGTFSTDAGMGLMEGIYTLAVLIPVIAVSVRRLHDTDHSGWWLLVALIPILAGSLLGAAPEVVDTDHSGWWLLVALISQIGGVIVLLAFMAQNSKPGENRYGSDPKLFGHSGYSG